MDVTLSVLLKIVDQCLSTNKKVNIRDILQLIKVIIPYKSAVFSQLCIDNGHIKSTEKFICDGCQKEWLTFYKSNNYMMIDPLIIMAINYQRALEWSNISKNHALKDKQFAKHISYFGLTNGIAYAYPSNQIIGKVSFISLQLDTKKQHDLGLYNIFIESVLPHIHFIFQGYSDNKSTPEIQSLSSRELEVLKWVGEGKRSKEIGHILTISENTVKYHLSNVYLKLGVTNRTHAISKAINHNLII
jgi:DNA-binding CsgD family transcriptional regulator